jgi:hypothetical protein
VSDLAGLERGYRRLLAFYPRVFRHENEQEVLAVLMAGARQGQRRPTVTEALDLIRGAVRMWLHPGRSRPRAVSAAVRLMYLGAGLELPAVLTVALTAGRVRSAIAQAHSAAHWHALLAQIVVIEVGAPIMVAMWLWLAWANGRGHDWARFAFMAFFGLYTVSLLVKLGAGAAAYASADLVANAVLWLAGLAAMVLIFARQSGPYYRPSPADG